jgi:hypothetical protein
MNGAWGGLAREHWQRHLPDRYAALDDPGRYFELLDQEATPYYVAIRAGMHKGVSPNDGTIGWAEFLDRVAWANQTAREIVATEMVFLPSEHPDHDDGGAVDVEGQEW